MFAGTLPKQARLSHLRDWLFRLRGVQTEPIIIKYRRIYLMPTGAGLVFIATLAGLLMASINFALNLGLVLTFLLAGAALAGAMTGFHNLLRLQVTHGRSAPVFCGDPARFSLVLTNNRGTPRHSLECVCQAVSTAVPALPPNTSNPVSVLIPTTTRGWLTVPWVKIQTRFPLGLVNVWAYVRPPSRCLVYPRPEPSPPPLPLHTGKQGDHTLAGVGSDDFFGLREHRPTDSPRHIAWKVAARGGPLMVKQFTGTSGGQVVLDWQLLPDGLDTEAKLSRLTAWVCEAHSRGVAWQLALPGARFGPGLDEEHYRACLEALALYGRENR